jgi:hypothetical protein
MSKKTQTIDDDSECELYLSDQEFEIEINQSDSKIVSEMKSESKQQKQEQEQEQKREQKQEQESKQTKKNKKKTIIQKINIEEENEQISFVNPCSNCEINRELLYLVRNLSDELNDVKNELKELKKMIKIKTDNINPPINKKNIMEWLNNYIVPTITFNEFVENIIINMGHFEFLLEYKLSDTIQKIIQTNIIKNDTTVYPLYASTEKSGKVYVFTEDEKWEIITIEHLIKFIKQIENKLFKHSIEWKTIYSGKNNFNSKLQEKCQNAISKIGNISYTQDNMMNRMKHDLCEQLKIVCR